METDAGDSSATIDELKIANATLTAERDTLQAAVNEQLAQLKKLAASHKMKKLLSGAGITAEKCDAGTDAPGKGELEPSDDESDPGNEEEGSDWQLTDEVGDIVLTEGEEAV